MTRTHARSQSPAPGTEASDEPALLKRMKVSHISGPEDVEGHFAAELFAHGNIHRLHAEYEQSGPFKHAVVDKLFQDDLLQRVKDEALAELSFSEKETDIYKVSLRVSRVSLEASRGNLKAFRSLQGRTESLRGSWPGLSDHLM